MVESDEAKQYKQHATKIRKQDVIPCPCKTIQSDTASVKKTK